MKSRAQHLTDLLKNHERVAIVGGPRTGKTTLTTSVDDRPVIHTDGFRDLPWDAVPDVVIARCAKGPMLIEGVQVARALRRGLKVDAVLYLDDVKAEQNPGQKSMTKAVSTVFMEWRQQHLTVPVVSPDLAPALE